MGIDSFRHVASPFWLEFSLHSISFWRVVATYALVLANIASELFDRRHRAIYDFIAGSQVNQASA